MYFDDCTLFYEQQQDIEGDNNSDLSTAKASNFRNKLPRSKYDDSAGRQSVDIAKIQQLIASNNYGDRRSSNAGTYLVVNNPMGSLNDTCCHCGKYWQLYLVQLPCRHYMCKMCQLAKRLCLTCMADKSAQILPAASQRVQWQQASNNQPSNKQMSTSPISAHMPATYGEDCVICLDTIVHPMWLDCNHVFCKGCIEEHLKYQQNCPTCGNFLGIQKGNQPDGKMECKEIKIDLPGYPGCGTIVITYVIHSGIQQVSRIMRFDIISFIIITFISLFPLNFLPLSFSLFSILSLSSLSILLLSL